MQCSLVEVQDKALLAAYFPGILFSPKDGGNGFFKTSVNFYWNIRCHIPEDGTLHSQFIQNFRYSIPVLSCLE
jgi:hypothetical protein